MLRGSVRMGTMNGSVNGVGGMAVPLGILEQSGVAGNDRGWGRCNERMDGDSCLGEGGLGCGRWCWVGR